MPTDASIWDPPLDSTIGWIAADIAKEQRLREIAESKEARGVPGGGIISAEARRRGGLHAAANRKRRKPA